MMTETSNLDRAFSQVCSNLVISPLNLFQIKRFYILSRKKGISSSLYRRDNYQAFALACVRQLISLRHDVVVVSLLVNKRALNMTKGKKETGFISANCPLN